VVDGWPESRIRRELRIYLEGQSEWPGWRTFVRDGKGVLRDAIKWTGGAERWAAELGVHLPGSRRAVERWSLVRMRDEVARLTTNRPDWPTRPEFRAAGLDRLYQAILRAGVREQLADELELRLPPGRKIIKGHWTDPVIERTLDRFVAGRTTWPCRREFIEAGLGGLEHALYRSGRRLEWADRYGLPVMRPGAGPRTPHAPDSE
jgi:hypothetical protein